MLVLRGGRGERDGSGRGWAARHVLVPLAVVLLAAPMAHGDGLPPVGTRPPGSASDAAPPRDAAWEFVARNDDPSTGWVLYRRGFETSSFEAFRLEAEVDATPAQAAVALRQNIRDPEVSQAYTSKQILRDEGDVLLIYSYVDLPLVSDRDVVTRSERVAGDGGTFRFQWAASDEGPAPQDGVVRLQKSSGSWEFLPLSGGRTLAIYESHTELGGAIPGWLISRLIRDTVVDGLDSLRDRLQQNLAVVPVSRPAPPPAILDSDS